MSKLPFIFAILLLFQNSLSQENEPGSGEAQSSGQTAAEGGPDSVSCDEENYPDGGGATTEEPISIDCDSSKVLPRIIGGSILSEEFSRKFYNSKNGGPISSENMLDCDFDSDCCWTNALPPNDKLQFVIANGGPDSGLMSQSFGTGETPSGKYAIVASPCADDKSSDAQLISCTIPCTDDPVSVTVKHWSSNDVILQVCERHAFFNGPTTPLLHCIDLPSESAPGPTKVSLPPGEAFDIVIVARNFVAPAGDVAIVDDVKVDYKLCSKIETKPEGDESELCVKIDCNFENGNICNYEVAPNELPKKLRRKGKRRRTFFKGPKPNAASKLSESEVQKFNIYEGRMGNYITGIYGAGEGEGYVASYLRPGQHSAVRAEFKDTPLEAAGVARMLFYKATLGLELYGCCRKNTGGKRKCKPLGTPDVVTPGDRKWQLVQMKCDAGTDEIIFICDNPAFSTNQGACGIDDIKIHIYDENLYDEDDPTSDLPQMCFDVK